MSTVVSAEPLGIDPDCLYPLPNAKAILGWGAHAMRLARRNGLVVKYIAGRGYVKGSDIIEHIEEHGKTSKDG